MDQDTLEWLHYLLRFDAGAPILIVATERNDETTIPDYPIKTLQVALTNAGKYSEIELKPLESRREFSARLPGRKTRNLSGYQPRYGRVHFSRDGGQPVVCGGNGAPGSHFTPPETATD